MPAGAGFAAAPAPSSSSSSSSELVSIIATAMVLSVLMIFIIVVAGQDDRAAILCHRSFASDVAEGVGDIWANGCGRREWSQPRRLQSRQAGQVMSFMVGLPFMVDGRKIAGDSDRFLKLSAKSASGTRKERTSASDADRQSSFVSGCCAGRGESFSGGAPSGAAISDSPRSSSSYSSDRIASVAGSTVASIVRPEASLAVDLVAAVVDLDAADGPALLLGHPLNGFARLPVRHGHAAVFVGHCRPRCRRVRPPAPALSGHASWLKLPSRVA